MRIQHVRQRDLETAFAAMIADPARITVNDQGRLVYEVDAPAGKRFPLMQEPCLLRA